jgi:phage baseplate assembly protein W
MGTISFKSVGKTSQKRAEDASAVSGSLTPIGFMTPLRFGGNSEGVFAMHYSLADQLHDNLRNLILTNWGERVMLYDFGANLRELTTELSSEEDFDSEAIVRIAGAINKWMPYVQPVDYVSNIDFTDPNNAAIVQIRITYNIPLLSIKERQLLVTLYTIG